MTEQPKPPAHGHFHLPYTKLSRWLVSLINRLQPTEDVVLVVTALLVGVGTGLGAVVFQNLISAVASVGYEWLPGVVDGQWYVVLVPALGGLIAGPLIYRYAREAKGHGVPEVMQAVALHGGRIRPMVAIIKAIASAFTIGSGGSAGREGPIVQIGSALGSSIGQLLHLSEDRIRNLVACGAAAGIAAIFNAPIAGVLFSLEVILGVFSVRYFSTVVISAVVASVISQAAFGNQPIFPLPVEYGVNNTVEFAFYPVLGIAAAVVGVLFVRLLYWTEDLFDNWKQVPEWVKPAIGGLLLGFVALVYPLVTGITWDGAPQIYNPAGHEVITSALANQLVLSVVLALLVLKMIATCLTLGSGGSGGVFAPTLFMGAMLGTAFELVINSLFPNVAAPPGAYAIVGMAAVFSASAHAPITAIIIVFELTDDYRIMLPLMLTVVVATLLSRIWLNKQSIYTLKLTRRGIHIQSGRDIDLMQGVMVNEAMVSPAPTISGSARLSDLRDALRDLHSRSICVMDDHEHLCGIVTLGDLQRTYETVDTEKLQTLTVYDICTKEMVTVHPDDVLWTAIREMGARDIGRLPVVMRGTGRLVGMVRRHDIMNAYNIAIARKLHDQHSAEQMRLNLLTGAHVFMMEIDDGAPVIGQHISDISWPAESVVAAITRKSKLIVPHGYTILSAGDQLTIVAAPEAEADLQQLFKRFHPLPAESTDDDTEA